MTVQTNGPIRGFIARWLMRLEASGPVLRIAFLGVTAASTFTSALALIGLDQYAPIALTLGTAGAICFAYAYTEFGVFNRKNRERADFGDNYSGPTMYMDRSIDAEQRAYLAYLWDPEDRPMEYHRERIQDLTQDRWKHFRNGMAPDEVEQ